MSYVINWHEKLNFQMIFPSGTRGVETAGVVTCATLPMYGIFTNTSPPQDSFPPSFSFILPRHRQPLFLCPRRSP